MKSNRTFGVEIEFTIRNTSPDEVAETLANYHNVRFESYNHDTRPHWKIVSDSSCGYELVSPILRGQEGLDEMKHIIDMLEQTEGVSVNRECGVHVHVHMENYNPFQIGNVLKYWSKYENEIDMVLPQSRRSHVGARGNSYCQGLAQMFNSVRRDYGTQFDSREQARTQLFKEIGKLQKQWKDGNLSDHRTMNGYMRLFNTRYVTVNLESYARYGTLEFRQHSGSLNSEKIANWVCFVTNLVDRAIKTKFVQVSKDESTMKNFANIFGEQQSRTILRYFESRAIHFGFGDVAGSYDHATSMRRV